MAWSFVIVTFVCTYYLARSMGFYKALLSSVERRGRKIEIKRFKGFLRAFLYGIFERGGDCWRLGVELSGGVGSERAVPR
jgi:uncharacterized membrane protein YbhN (UPF0104 family)